MEQIISKEEVNKLMSLKGEVRGAGMKGYAEFILKEEDEEGLERLEKTMMKLGYPIKYRKMRAMKFFPIGLEALTLLAIKRLFNYDGEKLEEMGGLSLKGSIITRLFMKYFTSPQRITKEAINIWRKGVTVGDLKVVEYNKDKKYSIIRLENFRLHPLHCHVVRGYLSSAFKMIFKGEAQVEESKCIYRGDDYHEFLIKW